MPRDHYAMTEPQRQLHRDIVDLRDEAARCTKRSDDAVRHAQEKGERLDAINRRHPEFDQAHLQHRVAYWFRLLALGGGIGVDAVLTAPVAEYLLIAYAHTDSGVAAAGRFLVPMMLILAELGVGLARRAAADRRNRRVALAWTIAGIVPVVVMPILVAETELVIAEVSQAAGTGLPVGGSPGGGVTIFTVAMALFTAFIHGYVIFGPHQEAAGYAVWHVQTSRLSRARRSADARSRAYAEEAAHCQRRGEAMQREYATLYPGWPPPAPTAPTASPSRAPKPRKRPTDAGTLDRGDDDQ